MPLSRIFAAERSKTSVLMEPLPGWDDLRPTRVAPTVQNHDSKLIMRPGRSGLVRWDSPDRCRPRYAVLVSLLGADALSGRSAVW